MTVRRLFPVSLLVVLALLAAPFAQAQVSLTTLGTPYTQNFDTLATTGTANPWADNSTIPGWYAQFSATPANPTTYRADSGGSNTGAIYSWGIAGVNPLTERAFGMLSSGTPVTVLTAVRFVNNTGATINSLQVNYNGEQWRDGGAATPVAQTTFFEYQVGNAGAITDANAPSTGWIGVSSLDFTSPTFTNTGAGAAIEGNQPANRTAKSATITVTVNPGQEIWLRWRDPNDGGNDHGLSVDDLSVTPQGAVALPQLSVNDVSQAETNGATTTFTFQVSLSAPAGPGGVTFDIATADGTAQDDNPATEDNDYVAQSLTGQTIPAGSSTFAFNVTVNGDVLPEPNETFFVNVTNVTGANVADGQGQGTIQNDDASCANLSIDDVTQNEGNGGTTTFAFTVSLSQAGCGTVTFDIATADGTAQDDNPGTEDNDYVPQSLTGQTITFPATYTFNVTVNGDTSFEPNETFFVNITNVSPGNVTATDNQGLGTIVNDDFTRIHDIQGNGAASPVAGQTVSARGIVTLLKSNGFFLQEELGDYDADPNTSEGIFVFTSSAPTVAVGDDASVTGTAVEFNGLTEISPVTSVTINSSGNALPAAVTLTALDLPTTASPDQSQLEKYESMRLFAPTLVTATPNDSFFDVETVLAPQPRPFREPGIPASDPIPPDPTSGVPDPNIPIWDENPERLNVDTNGRAGSTGETLTSNVTLTNVAGPLDFAFGRYRLINEANLTRTADMSAVPVPVPAANEFTIAGYNIENFNNNATQRQKAALTVRDVLRLPDIVGTVEIFDLADLQALATEIQTISGVTYSAHLIEQDGTSEDSDQDVGFLVKTSRVSVTSVTAERTSDTFINPNTGLPELLHDRPPLLLTATVDPSGPSPQPVFVIVNHLRSFIDVELVAGEGPRVRAKRKAQAESLADLLNDLQTANPTTPVISVGDYNAFQFNSGYDDSISVLKGMPTPDDQIVVDQSPDLVNPNFTNLLENVPAAQRYSFIFEGTPQSLDHVLVNAAAEAINTGIAVARVNADFPEVSAAVYASNATRPEANSDHDPVVAYFQLASSADVSITKTDNVDPVNAGQNFFYTITVDNSGPDAADDVSWSDTLPAGTTFVSLSSPGGWSCTTPAVGATGTVTCSTASLAVTSAAFTLTVAVDAGLANGTVLSNTATVTTTTADSNNGNDSDTETTTVNTSVDLQLSKTDSPDPVNAGGNISYQITVTNNGPSNAASASWTDTLPAGTTFVSLSAPGGWSCTTPAVGAAGTVTCNNTSFGVTADAFTLVVKVDENVASGTVISNTAAVTSSTTDPNPGNESGTAQTTVTTTADLQVSKTDSPDPVNPGNNLSYTITVTNAGPSNAAGASWTDTLPAGTTFVSLSTTGGWSCTTPAVGATGTVTCNNASFLVTVDFFTLVVKVDESVAPSTVLSNTATVSSSTPDPNPGNESATAMTTVGSGSADVGVVKADTPDPVVAGAVLTYTIAVTNAGPSNAAGVTMSDTVPAGTTFLTMPSTPAGWSCSTPGVGGTGTISCTIPTFPVGGTAVFEVLLQVNGSATVGTIITNTATVTTTTPDPNGSNDSSTTNTTVQAISGTGFTHTKTVTGDFRAGGTITYTATLTNNMGHAQGDNFANEWADILPSELTLVSANASSGSLVTNVPGGFVTWNGSIPDGGTVTITIVATIDAGVSGPVSNQANAIVDTDGNGTNETGIPSDDPSTGAANDPTTIIVGPSGTVTGTKSVSGTFVQGSNVTYTIVLTNNMLVTQPNNFQHEFTDILPAGLTYVSSTASSGTAALVVAPDTFAWNGSIPPGGTVTITITAMIAPSATGVISNQGNVIYDDDGGNSNESSTLTDDPSTGAANDPTSFTVIPAGVVTATKSASGTFTQGSTVTYTIVLTKNAGSSQGNNPGHELTDVLPSSLTLVNANASSGTASANVGTNTVTWNGSIASGGSVTITITATVNNTATGTVSNQATVSYDSNSDGTNDGSGVSDDPSTGTGNDPTVFTVASAGDADGDGVPDSVEQGAPNGGDGNGDGIPDYQQGTAASIPAATGSGYLTLQSSCALQNVRVVNEDEIPVGDHGYRYPHGLIEFRAPCSSATFSLYIYGSGAVSSYRKYGPLPPGGPAQWYQLPGATFQVVTVGSLHPRRVNFSLTDGGTGDDTPVDGVIVDQGGPADPDAAVPTASEWALLLMAGMLAAAAVLALRR